MLYNINLTTPPLDDSMSISDQESEESMSSEESGDDIIGDYMDIFTDLLGLMVLKKKEKDSDKP